ncbi:hypothetical protein ACFQMF_07930 [Halorubrum rutilum]|uniref:DUF8009 domain-containing protein n=1 Tax=Halorubrum rutilum TaxID=1364933 RepID=A0ABD6AKC2_9EURY|nr:hypothetical protein [Halorubrum rutilum]
MSERGEGGPDRIRSIAVHREDVASALEATLRSDREVVLRVTPPFSGRMRARLHAVDAGASDPPGEDAAASGERDGDPPTPIHVDPRELVAEVPPYPEVDETAAAHPDADLETRRRLHEEAVESWRERVRDSVVESVAIEVDEASRDVDVTALG